MGDQIGSRPDGPAHKSCRNIRQKGPFPFTFQEKGTQKVHIAQLDADNIQCRLDKGRGRGEAGCSGPQQQSNPERSPSEAHCAYEQQTRTPTLVLP